MIRSPHPNPLDSGSELRSTSSIPGVVPEGEGVIRLACCVDGLCCGNGLAGCDFGTGCV